MSTKVMIFPFNVKVYDLFFWDIFDDTTLSEEAVGGSVASKGRTTQN